MDRISRKLGKTLLAGTHVRRRLDESGASAVEFALLAPVILLIYFGGFELTQALSVNRLVALTSGTVTNLVSQYTTISASSQMPDILAASSQVLSPFPASKSVVVISSITIDNSGNATVAWSQALNGSARNVGQSLVLPAALDIPNSTVLLGETSYAYTPTVEYIPMAPINLYSSVYMLPRASSVINLTP